MRESCVSSADTPKTPKKNGGKAPPRNESSAGVDKLQSEEGALVTRHETSCKPLVGTCWDSSF